MTNILTYQTVVGALGINSHYVGRVNITMNDTSYQQIGKVWNGNFLYKDPASGLEIASLAPFEILACSP
jgi:hypothetical protein